MSLFESASLVVTPNGVKESKLYSVKPTDGSGDLTVTRATSATRVNAAGLVEEVPVNLVQYSEQFDNASWVKTAATVTANSIISPYGTQDADTLTANGVLGFHSVMSNSITVTTLPTTLSVYAKKNTNDFIQLSVVGGIGGMYANFNIANGVVGSVGTTTGGNPTNLIESVGNGWYRCSMTFTPTASGATNFYYSISNTATDTRLLANTLSTSVYIWGAQLVQGSVAKDYFPTTTRLNVPRLDYTGSTCPSLLVEPQRTNRALYSNTFDNAYWTKTSVTLSSTSGGIIDGGNYYTVTCDGTTGTFKGIGKTFLNDSPNTYSLSVFAKSGTSSTLIVSSRATLTSNDTFASFNLSNGTINSQNGGTANIVNYGNGWYRCTFIVVNAGTFTNQASIFFGHPINAANGLTLLISGAQAEISPYATSYIPTTTATVTRNSDVINKPTISSLIGQTEGTIFSEFKIPTQNSASVYIGISDGTFNNSVMIGKEGGVEPDKYLFWIKSNASSILNNTSTSLSSDYVKCALAYNSGSWAAYFNGTLVAQGTSTFTFSSSLSVFGFGSTGGFASLDNKADIKQVAIWKTRLTNAELATLTTL